LNFLIILLASQTLYSSVNLQPIVNFEDSQAEQIQETKDELETLETSQSNRNIVEVVYPALASKEFDNVAGDQVEQYPYHKEVESYDLIIVGSSRLLLLLFLNFFRCLFAF
jgi:hypothetical protein